ncbi:MAG: radical SAM family heme chaperone HemW [Bacillota bacterium]|nr:radical SAM family heme chaperone HemW [Bacillota bacterium]
MKNIGVYIHVPFCDGKCFYCDFYSNKATEAEINRYTKQICKEINRWGKELNRQADTLYFGGGTPSLLGAERLIEILSVVKNNFLLKEDSEITLEVNPASGNFLDFEKLFHAGFNRLSIGLQSANDNELKLLGRRHSALDAENTVKLAQKAGFSNISLDLMLGIPEQTESSLQKSIDFCKELCVTHISGYLLKIEENTKFHITKKRLNLPNEDLERELYFLLVQRLQKYGFSQYEISNFANLGKESRHNLKYWNALEYIGIGPSAHSFIEGERFYYNRSKEDFYNGKIVNDGRGGDESEYLMLRLRLSEGVNYQAFEERFNKKLPKKYIDRVEKFLSPGFVECTENGFNLTKDGFIVSNSIISEILDD